MKNFIRTPAVLYGKNKWSDSLEILLHNSVLILNHFCPHELKI